MLIRTPTAKAEVDSPPVETPDVLTMAMWLRIHHGGPARPQPLISCEGGAGEFLLTVPPTFPGSSVVLTIAGREMGSQAHSIRGVIRAGQWHHLAVTCDSKEWRASFLVDGRDVTETSGLRRDFKIAGPLLIGRRVNGGPLPFDGQIDDVRIYSRVLSMAEISALAGMGGGE